MACPSLTVTTHALSSAMDTGLVLDLGVVNEVFVVATRRWLLGLVDFRFWFWAVAHTFRHTPS